MTTNHDSQITFLRFGALYDVRRNEGGALIHLGTVRREGKAWIVSDRDNTQVATVATRKAAGAHLADSTAPLPA